MNIITLFSGAGGLDLEFEKAGFRPIWANCEITRKRLLKLCLFTGLKSRLQRKNSIISHSLKDYKMIKKGKYFGSKKAKIYENNSPYQRCHGIGGCDYGGLAL